jgi:hypothetical protein
MKNIILLFVSVFAFAQNPNHQTFLNHNWRLNYVQDGNNAPVYVDASVNYPIVFQDQNVQFQYTINVCNWHYFGYNYLANENIFIKIESASSLVICMGPGYPVNHNFFDNFVEGFNGLANKESQFPFVITPLPNNQYSLDIYNPSGKRLNFNSTGLSAEDISINQKEIYPNPVTAILNISTSTNIKSVTLYQMNGQKVFETNQEMTTIDMTEMAAGVYLLKITTGTDQVTIRKIIKR